MPTESDLSRRRAAPMPILHDLQEVAPLLGGHGSKSPVVEDQKFDALEAVSASPFFEMTTVPLGQVTEASVSPEPQATVQVWFSQFSCLTTCKLVERPAGPA